MYVLYCGPVAFIYAIKFLFYLIDTNFSSQELLVAEILSILLVYSLHLSMFFSYIESFLKFWPQDSQLFPISYYIIINNCHIYHLIPISAL